MKDTQEGCLQNWRIKGEMLLSPLEDKPLHQGQQKDPTHIQNQLEKKFPKLPPLVNLNSCYRLHFSLLHKLHVKGLVTLDPEDQIKYLEYSLRHLEKNKNKFNRLQIKNSSCPSKNSSYPLKLGTDTLTLSKVKENYSIPGLLFKPNTELALKLNTKSDCEFTSKVLSNMCDSDTNVFNDSLQNGLSKKYMFYPVKYNPNTKIPHSTTILSSSDVSSKHLISELEDLQSSIKQNDIDNQFEFTVEQEEIVSFVCSPPPLRKERIQQNIKCNGELINDDPDLDSDKQSDLSTSKVESLVENISKMSCKSCSTNILPTEKFSAKEQMSNVGREFCHEQSLPPSLKKTFLLPSFYKFPVSSHNMMRTSKAEGITNLCQPVKPGSISTIPKRPISFISQETILFREASLRSCYNIENILKDVRPPLNDVEEEVSKVKEAIFSGVRLSRTNEDVIPDSVLSVLDILKSWIKLNSHFEREEFKNDLETYGIDPSIQSDFMQWQCVSRIFIDKIINGLKKITFMKHSKSAKNQLNSSNNFITNGFVNNAHQTNLSNVNSNNGLSCNLNDSCLLPNNECIQNKHWKQRRFQSNHSKPEKKNAYTKRKCKSKFTVNTAYNRCQNASSCNGELVLGQGDIGSIFCDQDVKFSKLNKSLPDKSNYMIEGSSNNTSSRNNLTQKNSTTNSKFENNIDLCNSTSKQVKEFVSGKSERNIYQLSSANDLSCNSVSGVMDLTSSHQFSMNTHSFPTIPPLFSSPFCFLNPNRVQSNLVQCPMNQNPIECVDTDLSENCVKKVYMKPGNYNPPQKPVHFQKVANNSIPIEDHPVVGISFHYENSQSSLQQSKSSNPTNRTPLEELAEEVCIKKHDDTWSTAVNLAQYFRESLMTTKEGENCPNLKVSDTVSLKSHFLLSDQVSEHSSNNCFKTDSDPEASSPPLDLPASIEISVIEPQLKTKDWLIKSFSNTLPENESNKVASEISVQTNNTQSEYQFTGVNKNNENSYELEQVNQCRWAQSNGSGDFIKSTPERSKNSATQLSKVEVIDDNNGTNLGQKKPRRIKKCQDDYITAVQNTSSMLYRKPKPIFKRPINKQVTYKLEDILTCVWNNDISNLFEEKSKSDKEAIKLWPKIRSTFYLQSIRCKLANHGYDTLDQALADFNQYFVEIKKTNKDDQKSIEVVIVLEQIFLNLIEKHFGIVYQPTQQFFGHNGMTSSLTPRRPKKNSRKY